MNKFLSKIAVLANEVLETLLGEGLETPSSKIQEESCNDIPLPR